MLKFLPRALAALALLLAPAVHAREVADSDPALWVVKDADTTIYLFGTVHILRPGLSWFDEAVRDAFDASGQVVTEIVEPEPAVAQGLLLKAALSEGGRTLSERLPEDKRAAYLDALAKAGIPAAAFEAYDPWFVSVNLTFSTLIANGFDPASGADPVITAAARAAGKQLTGFETMERQLGLLDGLSEQAQIAMLMATVKDLPRLHEVIDEMVAAWSSGDADAIARLLNDNLVDSPEAAKVLLTDRNARWAEWIEQRMAEPGTVFVAVGAGHLAGEDSVQAFLEKRNLKAERVEY